MPASTSPKIIAPDGWAVKVASGILVAGFAVLAALYLSGCTAKPTTYRAPSAEKLVAKQVAATKHFQAAKRKFAPAAVNLRAAQTSHTRAETSHAAATRWVTLIVPAVDELLLKAPPDLKPEVEAIKLQVASLSAEIEKTTGEMATTKQLLARADTGIAEGTQELTAGLAANEEINAKLAPAHFADVEALAAHATRESQEKADWHNKYDTLKRQSWMHRILGIAGALAAAGLVFLWFTGRIAKAGAKAAAALR